MGIRLDKEKILNVISPNELGEDQDQIDKVLLAYNPVAWCEANLTSPFDGESGLKFRGFQKDIIMCDDNLRVIRTGRQLGKTVIMAADILWNICTEPRYSVVVIAPMSSHLEVIREHIMSLIGNNENITRSIVINSKKDPFELTLTNGSSVRGYAFNQNPLQARGKTPRHVYLDEADYLTEEINSVISGYRLSGDIVKFWVSSTPSGQRGWFYEICHDNRWTQFHHTSLENPHWNKELEEELRSLVRTQDRWEREVLAEFGDLSSGLFKNRFIDFCLEKGLSSNGSFIVNNQKYYSYNDMSVIPDGRYIFGIDWNGPRHGVQILVGLVPSPDNVIIVDRISIETKDYTQLNAVNSIIEANKKYAPEHIYVDAGYGTTQIELLHKYGEEHPESGLRDKIVALHMGMTIDTRDPFTHETVKMYAKDLVIENAIMFIENGFVTLPKEEDKRDGLVEELRNYAITGWSSAGKPKYTEDNDHLITCFCLLLYAVAVEKTTKYRQKKEPQLSAGQIQMRSTTKDNPNIVQRTDFKNNMINKNHKTSKLQELASQMGFIPSSNPDPTDPDNIRQIKAIARKYKKARSKIIKRRI